MGKPAHIFHQVGRLPVLAGGNADVDIKMLECARFGLLVHHDDGAENALAAAKAHVWTVVSMKSDWSTVF